MNTATMLTTMALLSSLLVIQGCSPSEPMGEAKINLVQLQTLDPEAGKEKVTVPNPVAGREVQKAIAMSGGESGSTQQGTNSVTLLMGNR